MQTNTECKKSAEILLAAVRDLNDICCDSDVTAARQHLEAAIAYLDKGERDHAERRITCAHIALIHCLELFTLETAAAKAYNKDAIIGDGDRNLLLAEVVREQVDFALEEMA